MDQYSTYGRLDSRDLQGIDLGFVGFNNRVRPDQLPSSFLEVCENGRLDRSGQWIPRNGVLNLVAPVITDESQLALSFGLRDTDLTGGTRALINTNDLEITFSGGHSLGTSGNVMVNLSGFTDVAPSTGDGNKVVTITSATKIVLTDKTYTNAGTGTTAITKPVIKDNLTNLIRGSCAFNDPFSTNNESYIILALTNNAKAIKVSDTDATPITINYPTGELVEDTCQVLQAFNKIFIFRRGKVAFEINFETTDIAGGGTITMSLVDNGNFSQPVTLTSSVCDIANNVCTVTTSAAHGLKVGQKIMCTLQGSSGLITNQFTQISSEDSFSTVVEEYTVLSIGEVNLSNGAASREGSTTTVNIQFDGTDLINTSNLKVGSRIIVAGASYSGTGGAAAVNTTQVITAFSTTGSTLNDTLKFTVSGLNDAVSGSSVTVSTPTDQFSFIVGQAIEDKADGSISTKPKFIRRVFSDLGLIHMPCPEFAELHAGRLIMPYQFDQTGSSGSPTITSRKVFDQLIASDKLDSNTYDSIFASLRFNAGTSDFTVGIKSFTDDTVLVFNRNSIHSVKQVGTEVPVSTLLTNEIGCVARKTIVQVGNNIYFLSDSGLYSLEFFEEFNLRGSQTPLSESVSKTIDRINQSAIDKSCAVYFNNRYYLALPLDNSTFNNAVLIYNFITKSWESLDFVDSKNSTGTAQSFFPLNTLFRYDDLIIAGAGIYRGVYSVDQNGGITLIEGNNSILSSQNLQGNDLTITQVGQTTETPSKVQGRLKTRMHTFNDLGTKKFKSFHINAESSPDSPSDFSIKIQTENIDVELDDPPADLLSASDYIGKQIEPSKDVSFRGRIGNMRAYGAQLQIENEVGRPIIKTIKTTALKTYKSPNPAE